MQAVPASQLHQCPQFFASQGHYSSDSCELCKLNLQTLLNGCAQENFPLAIVGTHL